MGEVFVRSYAEGWALAMKCWREAHPNATEDEEAEAFIDLVSGGLPRREDAAAKPEP